MARAIRIVTRAAMDAAKRDSLNDLVRKLCFHGAPKVTCSATVDGCFDYMVYGILECNLLLVVRTSPKAASFMQGAVTQCLIASPKSSLQEPLLTPPPKNVQILRMIS